MRKYIILFAMVLIAISMKAQIGLKGIKLGEKGNPSEIKTTIGGIEGVIITDTISDGRCYYIEFHSTQNDLSPYDSSRLQKNIESIYDVQFNEELTVSKDGVYYSFVSNISEILFIINSEELTTIHSKEREEEFINDF